MKNLTFKLIFVLTLLFGLMSEPVQAQKEELRLEILNGHSGGGVLAVAVSSDGKFALTGSTDQTALLWDLETGKQLRRFFGYHEDAVSCVQFSKDGRFVLTASYDSSAQLWETATGRRVHGFGENRGGVLIKHSGKILSCAISADMKQVATAGEDKTARIWDFETGKQLFELRHAGRVNSIVFSPDSHFLLTGGEDKIARLYPTQTGKEERQFVGHTGMITSVAYSPDGKQVLTGSEDTTARLWNVETSIETRKLELVNVWRIKVKTVAFTPSGNRIVVGGESIEKSVSRDSGIESDFYEGGINVFDMTSGKRISNIKNSADDFALGASSVATVSDQKLLRGSQFDRIASAFQVEEAKEIQKLKGESEIVNSVSVSHNFSSIITGSVWQAWASSGAGFTPSGSETSSLWDLTKGQPSEWWKERKRVSNGLRKDTKEITKQTVEYIQASYVKVPENSGLSNSRNKLASVIVNETLYESVTFSPDGRFLAIAGGEAEVWDIGNHKQLFRLNDFLSNDTFITKVVFSPNSKFLLTASKNGLARLWEAETGAEVRQFDAHNQETNALDFSRNGKTIATASNDKTVRLWNAETGKIKLIIKDFSAPVWSLAFSPDGKTSATASGGEIDPLKDGIGNAARANAVQLWDVETGKEIERFTGDFKISANKFAGFKAVAYSPDGKFIAAGSFDGKVYLRNNETKELKKFEGHTDTVNTVKFANDANGKLLVVSGSSDSTVRIWDAAAGEEICALVTFRDGNWAVVQTRTGRYDAPNGGDIEGIQWVFGNEVIALNQLKDIYYTPNLLPRLLGYNKEPLADVRPLTEIKLFPEIVERQFDKATSLLTVKLKNRGGGIGAVRLMVNGSLATEDARSEELKRQLKTNPNLSEAVVAFNIKNSAGFNPAGENRVEIVTHDFDRKTQRSYVSSDPKTSARSSEVVNFAKPENELKKPTLYAIVGGVSDYNGTQLDLNFAAKDAEDFANALGIAARRLFCPKENPKCEDKVKIKLLTTNSKDAANLPTKANFRAAFSEIAQNARAEDILVVYLAGHGTSLNVGDAETYFFLTQESENGAKDAVAKNTERSISNTELLEWLTQAGWRKDKKGIDAANKVLILDTCAAGAFENAITRDKQRELSADQIRALEKLRDRAGLQILMGSAANQSAYEASQYGQGLLTYALLEGIKGAALKNQTSVETGALFDYAVGRVPKMDISNGASGLQSPRVFGSTSIPIGLMMTKEDREAIKILESPLPVFAKPFIFKRDENFDTLGLIGALAKTLDEASNPQSRGNGNQTGASLVYVDEDNFPGAYRVTGTYTEENGVISVNAVLRKDGKIIVPIGKVSGKELIEVTKLLLDEVLKVIGKISN